MDHDLHISLAPRLVAIIVDRSNTERLENLLREKLVRFHFMWDGMGSANSEIRKAFGLSGTVKTVCMCIEPAVKAEYLMNAAAERMEMSRPGNGISFIMPISGISAFVSKTFTEEQTRYKERLVEWMDRETEQTKESARFEMIAAVVNQGFSENVMDAARSVGARGGTIINARHSGLADAIKFFGVTLQEEKEIVMIVVYHHQKKELMQLIGKSCGMGTEAQGIVVSLPVENCLGIEPDESAEQGERS